MKVVDRAGFEALFGKGRSVVVDFYADWCRPCHVLAPELETLARTLGDEVTVVKLDIEADPEVAQHFGVMSIPTVIRFSEDGNEMARSTGALPAAELARRLGLGAAEAAAS